MKTTRYFLRWSPALDAYTHGASLSWDGEEGSCETRLYEFPTTGRMPLEVEGYKTGGAGVHQIVLHKIRELEDMDYDPVSKKAFEEVKKAALAAAESFGKRALDAVQVDPLPGFVLF